MNIDIVKDFVELKLSSESSGHDYLHALRVLENSRLLITTSVDEDVIIVSSLIHDLIDHKLEEKYKATVEELNTLLKDAKLKTNQITHVFDIINNISFSKGNVPTTEEGRIVQDADRLDALGAIGIARTFSYGGKNNRLIYNKDTIDSTDSVSHFYQKLFKLYKLMNTEKGKEEALLRTKYMKQFIMKLDEEIGGQL